MNDIIRTRPAKTTKPRSDELRIRKPKVGPPVIRLELENPAVSIAPDGRISYLEPNKIDRIEGFDVTIDQQAAIEIIETTDPVTGLPIRISVAGIEAAIAVWAARRIDEHIPEER